MLEFDINNINGVFSDLITDLNVIDVIGLLEHINSGMLNDDLEFFYSK